MTNRQIGLGPVFVYEWITASRRWQAYAQRSLFVSVLLLALVAIWLNMGTSGSAISDLAILGRRFFLGLIGTQLALVLLAAPAATAGAICVDRARGTLMHMLVTDLSAGEIVLGKLAARVAPVLMMLACTFPVLEILTLLGGIDPNAILGAVVVTVGVAVLSCSLAMTLSLWVGKPHQALLLTYSALFIWLLARPMFSLLALTFGWPWPAPPQSAEPFFLALAPYWSPGKAGWGDYVLFLAVTVSISALLSGVAILRIRSVCTRESASKARRSRSSLGPRSIWRLLSTAVPSLNPSLDGNPVVWRECRRSSSSRWSMVIAIGYAGLSILFSVVSVFWSSAFARAVVNGAQVSVGLLLLGVTAASSLAEERANGSLDVLLSTPLSARQIVIGKWLGALRIVPLLAVMPAFVIWANGLITNSESGWQTVLMCAFVLCAGAAITSVGVAMSAWFSRPGQAALSTVAVWVLVTVGWPMLASILMGPRAERLMMGSPMLWATIATGLERGGGRWLWELFWVIFYGLSAVGILFATVTSFDRRLGRLDGSLARVCVPSRSLQAITAIYFAWGTFFTLILLCAPPESIVLPLGTGLLFSLGLLVLAVRAAWPIARACVKSDRAEPGGGAGHLPISILTAKWAVAGRVLPWVVLLPSTTAFCASAQSWLGWARFLIVFGFVLAVCLIVVSLGVAVFAWCRGGVRAVILMTVLWGLTNIGWIAMGRVGFRHQFGQAGTSGDPFFDLVTLILWTNEMSANDFRALAWIFGASMGYGVGAGALVLAAQWRGGPAIGRTMRRPAVSPRMVMIQFQRREGQT